MATRTYVGTNVRVDKQCAPGGARDVVDDINENYVINNVANHHPNIQHKTIAI